LEKQNLFCLIRRIVQDERYFFKIKPGLWALKGDKEKVLKKFEFEKSKDKRRDFNHRYFQGSLLEIGNLKGFHTYIPAR